MGEHSDTSTQHTSAGRRFLVALRSSAGFAVVFFAAAVGIVGQRLGTALWQALFVLVGVLLLTLAADHIRRARRAPDGSGDDPGR